MNGQVSGYKVADEWTGSDLWSELLVVITITIFCSS